jgi:plasmid stabilization system protein ParE
MKRLAYHPAARAEFEAEVRYCETERAGAGAHLRSDIIDALVLVDAFPAIGRLGPNGTRRMVTRIYHFIIHYELIDGLIVIFAITHPSREPAYWGTRRTS